MSLKKFFCGALAASMIFSASLLCSAAPEESANAKLARIEVDTYGAEQSGALLDRISRLEKSYSGENTTGNMNARIDAIYDVLYNNEIGPSLLAKINALEWNVNHQVQRGGLDARLTVLETEILGKTNEGTFNERINALAKESFGEEILPIAQVPVEAGTLIKVATTVPVGSKDFQTGDTVPIEVVEDVFVNGALVFAKGLPGEGSVADVRRAKNIFSNGKIEIDFNTLKTIDGQDAKVFAGVEAIDAMNAASMGRGLSLLGQTFSGKNKSVSEIFIRGKNVDLPAGIELYVQIKSPIVVYGLLANGNGLSEDEMNLPAPPPEEPTPSTEPVTPPTEPVTPSTTPTPPTTPATPPTTPAREPETIIERVDPEPPKPAPTEQSNVEPRPDEGKTLDGSDGEIIEIIDED